MFRKDISRNKGKKKDPGVFSEKILILPVKREMNGQRRMTSTSFINNLTRFFPAAGTTRQ
jgi:hypothetical protein